MEMTKRNKVQISIFTFIVVIINAFIIVTASLSNEASRSFSNFFANIFKAIFNSSGADTTEIVDVESIDINYDTSYQYNSINGYQDNEIVVGTSKRLVASFLPDNATNTAVKYEVSDSNIASIRQEGSYLYVTGLEVGNVTITGTSISNENLKDTYSFNVVAKKAPSSYEVKDIDVYQGSLLYLPIEVTEKYPSYYNLDLLSINNSSPSIVSKAIEYEGLYYASSIGEDVFTIGGTKSFKVNVKSNSEVIYPSMSSISGKDTTHSGSSSQYSVEFLNEPTSKDMIWSVSNDKYGVINKDGYFTAKEVSEEVNVTITAKSMLNPSLSISKSITILPKIITDFVLSSPTYGDITNKSIDAETGQQITININSSSIKEKGVSVTSNDTNLAKAYEQGSAVLVECLIEGDVRITITSNENPELSKYVDIHVVTRGVINRDNFAQFAIYVRKSLGHFSLFLLDGVFVLLLLSKLNEIFDYKHKKWWHYLVIALVFAIFMAFLSEFIQFFIPYRDFSFVDIGVDLLGYVIGAGIVLLIQTLVRKHKKKSLINIEQEPKDK